jgi:LacI family transcriptional regulator
MSGRSEKVLEQLRSVESRDDRPLYAQIRRTLRILIQDHFKDGQKFFTEPELVSKFGASRGTVRRALEELTRDGLLDRQIAKGSFVRKGGAPVREIATLQVIVPDLTTPFFTALLHHISIACRKRNFRMQVNYTHKDDKCAEVIDAIKGSRKHKNVILLHNLPQMTLEIYQDLSGKGYHVVNIGPAMQDYPGPSLAIDNEATIRIAVEHLMALGHRRIVYLINEPEVSGNVIERSLAFQAVVRERGLSEARAVSCHTQFWEDSYAQAYPFMQAVFSQGRRPTAIIAHSDPGAWAAMRWLADSGYSVPSQVSVLGFGDHKPSRFTYPKLSTLAQPLANMAARALEILAMKPMPTDLERFSPTLVVRESTGPAPTV